MHPHPQRDEINPAVQHLPPGAHEHEGSDISIRGIFSFGAILVVSAAVLHILLWGLFSHYDRRAEREGRPERPLESAEIGRAPRLQANPAEDLARMRGSEAGALDAYGWADPEAGTVRLPVARAMQLIAERGLPPAPEPTKDSRARWQEEAARAIRKDRAARDDRTPAAGAESGEAKGKDEDQGRGEAEHAERARQVDAGAADRPRDEDRDRSPEKKD